MSQAPSTFGTMITSSLSPISVTSVVMSSRHQGESSAFTRVQSAVSPRSISLPIFTRPARACSLFSTVTASSRLPSTMSALAAVAGSFPTIFSLLGSKKWIIRDGVTGISVTGSGAPTARGLRKSRGVLMSSRILGGRGEIDLVGVDDLGVEGALHHLERRLGQVLGDVGHGVAGHHDLEVAQVGVEGRVEDALLGDHAGHDDPVDALLAEHVLDRGAVEHRVAALEHEGDVLGRGERLEQLGVLARPHPL